MSETAALPIGGPKPSRGARLLLDFAGQNLEDDHARVARILESYSGVVSSDVEATLTIIALRLLTRLAEAESVDQVTLLKQVDSRGASTVFGGPLNTSDDAQHTVSEAPRR